VIWINKETRMSRLKQTQSKSARRLHLQRLSYIEQVTRGEQIARKVGNHTRAAQYEAQRKAYWFGFRAAQKAAS
jgi:hypothetical protein